MSRGLNVQGVRFQAMETYGQHAMAVSNRIGDKWGSDMLVIDLNVTFCLDPDVN